MKLLQAQIRLWPTNRSNVMSSSPSFDIRTTYSSYSLRCVNVTKQTANVTREKSETDDISKMSFDFGVELRGGSRAEALHLGCCSSPRSASGVFSGFRP